MAADSASTNTGCVNDDLPPPSNCSMLMAFIYDTSSFSDRQVQLANGDITTTPTPTEGCEPASGSPSANTSDDTKRKEGDEPVSK